jgi:multiple sugar transport system substrate-binding protein
MKSSPFQIILIALFGFFIIVGMVTLYFTKGKERASVQPTKVSLWGSAPAAYVNALINAIKAKEQGLEITYKQIAEADFDQSLIEALASGVGPDSVIITQESVTRLQDKLLPISYQVMKSDDYKHSYVTAAEIMLSPWGILALPFGIDPLVAYWNRDIFANAGLAVPPRYWDEFPKLAELLTKKSADGKIAQSAVALGEYSNVNSAKAIISALALEAGTDFVARQANGKLVTTLNNQMLTDAMDFYTEWANPSKEVYSWSRSMPNSQAAFARGDVAVYFDFASAVGQIKAKNPNLDFDVTYFPTGRNTKNNITFGEVLSIATLKSTKNPAAAVKMAFLFGSAPGAQAWANSTGLPPVRRDLLSTKGSRPYDSVFYDSALWSRSWVDPDSRSTDPLFRDLVENITSGWMTTSQSVNQFRSRLNNLY